MKKITALLTILLAFTHLYGQQVDRTAYERYIDVENYGKLLPGYYIQGKKKVEVNIKYVPPIEMQNPDKPIIIDKGEGEEVLSKNKIDAVSYGDHLYIPEDLGDSVIWVMLAAEGAIRTTIFFDPEPEERPQYYKINHMVTNTITHESYFLGALAINFNKVMASLTAENEEISRKIADRKQGYRFIDYKKIIAEYNLWFQTEYPKKIKYFGDVPDFQSIIDNDLGKYLPKN
ncbi:MAG: hypothetical protein ABFS32_11650 [Bacteroidota bacterium]